MAFRRFKRRKQRLSWFPPIKQRITVGDTNIDFGFNTFSVNVLADGSENTLEIPITYDFGSEEIENFANENVPTQTLSDLMGSGWRLRRAVGKIYAAFSPIQVNDNVVGNINTGVPSCIFAAGLMVRRVTGAASNTNASVGLFQANDYTDPWIWRRTWILGQNANVTKFGPLGDASALNFANRPVGATGFIGSSMFSFFPHTTAHYGSMGDGPHIDAKTNRIIGTDERLFIHFSAKALPIQPQLNFTADSFVEGVFDLRLLGHLKRFTNRRNASR